MLKDLLLAPLGTFRFVGMDGALMWIDVNAAVPVVASTQGIILTATTDSESHSKRNEVGNDGVIAIMMTAVGSLLLALPCQSATLLLRCCLMLYALEEQMKMDKK